MSLSIPPAAQPREERLPLDRLELIDTTLYQFQNLCRLIEALGSACDANATTDGVSAEPFHVVFGWIGDELHDARLGLNEVHQALVRG